MEFECMKKKKEGSEKLEEKFLMLKHKLNKIASKHMYAYNACWKRILLAKLTDWFAISIVNPAVQYDLKERKWRDWPKYFKESRKENWKQS